MKVDEPLFSALPYRPEILRDKYLYAIGHPDLVPVLKKLAEEPALDLPGQSQVIKEHPNLIVQTSLLRDNDFPWSRQVIKQFRWRGTHNYLASPLKKSKAIKSYLAACHLLKHGLGTPMPLGAVEVRRRGFVSGSAYLSEAVEGFVDLKQYRKVLPDGKIYMAKVLQMLAVYTLRMHDSGMMHKDLNLRNFLLAGSRGAYSLYLVDLNRAWCRDGVPLWFRAMDLSRLDLRHWHMQFYEYYCQGRFDVKTILKMAAWTRTWRRQWRRMAVGSSDLRHKIGMK